MKKFNTTGLCFPGQHYMVDLSEKLNSIVQMIDNGSYFTINRARQYGKTTTLHLLAETLQSRYTVFFLSFEGLGESSFESEHAFCRIFARLMEREIKFGNNYNIDEAIIGDLKKLGNSEKTDFVLLTDFFLELCQKADRPIVLMIDEVDQAGNYRVFMDFLGVLRNNYLQRGRMPAFQSVVLAGVYDIKNLKLKIRPEGEHQYNSPWNITADFNVDMSFSQDEIAKMLLEYENDHHTKMNIEKISKEIYDYTCGYPYMVSRICKIMDERIGMDSISEHMNERWTNEDFLAAVKCLLREDNLLFDDMQKKLADFPELKQMLYNILLQGARYSYESNSVNVELGVRFGFLREQDGMVIIANRIYETKLYNMFISEEETSA